MANNTGDPCEIRTHDRRVLETPALTTELIGQIWYTMRELNSRFVVLDTTHLFQMVQISLFYPSLLDSCSNSMAICTTNITFANFC